MLVNLALVDLHVKDHVAELMREAEHDRLVALATGPGRPLRTRLAEWLHASAERIEGNPRRSLALRDKGYA